jgi:hypothetical protein
MKILKEEVIGMKSPWVARARLVLYHDGKVRRVELMLEKVDKIPYQDEVGWTAEELAGLHNKLLAWKNKIGE